MRIVPVGIKKLHSSGKHLRYAFLSPTRVWCEYNADDGMLFRYVSDKVVIERVSQQ
ncbi:hypothetical protein [Kosmotoga sp. DU53]|uniref:hypothetical protein n=1 Tax=Kosmotoga sp. DU53 TaxID=1310160 RepID=UPI0013724A89|nr:hypothetical protein [Kosmotoga sp. DU53]